MRKFNEISEVIGDRIIIDVPYTKLKARLWEHIGEDSPLGVITPDKIKRIMCDAQALYTDKSVVYMGNNDDAEETIFDRIRVFDNPHYNLKGEIEYAANKLVYSELPDEEIEKHIGDLALALGLLADKHILDLESCIKKSIARNERIFK